MRAVEESCWARALAAGLLAPLGQRWAHTLGVVDRAKSFVGMLPDDELDVLVASAFLHDIGYAPSVARTGFHPLDGGVFLRSLGHGRLACLIARHSGAWAEAQERGLATHLDDLPEERSHVADLLTYCDLVTAADGSPTTPEARLADVLARYRSDHPVGRAVIRSRTDLLTCVRAIEAWSDLHP